MKLPPFIAKMSKEQQKRLAGVAIIIVAGASLFYIQSAKGAAYTWDGGGSDGTCGGGVGDGNKWSCALNWSSDIVPTSTDTVTFNGTSTKNADITSAVDVAGITIASGYTGTITQVGSNTINVRASGYSQADGTFTGGSGSITIANSGDFTLSGGTFTSTTGTFQVTHHWTHTAGGTFNHNNGTVTFASGAATNTWDVNATETFNNFTISTGTGVVLTITSGDTLIVLGTLTHSGTGTINTGTIEVQGNVVTSATTQTGTATFSFLVAGDQTITTTGTARIPNINVAKASGNLSVLGANLHTTLLTISSGTFIAPSGTLQLCNFTHTAGGSFTHNSGTVTWGISNTTCTIDVATTETFYNFGTTGASNDSRVISSGDTLVVANSFDKTQTGVNTGTIEVQGNMTAIGGVGGTATLNFLVGGDQSITVSSTASIPNINVAKSSGTLSVTGGDLTISGFTLASGTFTSPSGTLTVAGGWTHTAGGTFNHNNSTVVFGGSTAAVDVATTETFYHLTINKTASNSAVTIGSGDTLVVLDTFNHTRGQINTGTVEVRATMIGSSSANNSSQTGTVAFLAAGDQTITGNNVITANVLVNKPSGTVAISGLFRAVAFTLASGTVTGGTSDITFYGVFTLSGGTFTSTSGTLITGRTGTAGFTHTGGTFNHNNGTVVWDAPGNTWDVAEPITFNNLTVSIDNGNIGTIAAGDTLVVVGTLFHETGTIGTGAIDMQGTTFNVGASAGGGTGTIYFQVAGDQSIGGSAGATAGLYIAKPSGTLSVASTNLTVTTYTQISGTFTAPTGTLTVQTAFTRTGGTLNHNNGTFNWGGTANGASVWDTQGSDTFNNFILQGGANNVRTIASGDTIVVTGTTTLTDAGLNTGTLEVHGDITIGSGYDGGSAILKFAGTANQTITATGAANFNGDVVIDKGAGKVTLATGMTLDASSQDFTITRGIFDLGTANIFTVMGTSGTVVIGTNGVLQGFGTGGSLILGVTLTNSGTVHLNGNGTTCGDADSIQIRSSVGGVQRAWNGTGKFIITDVDVRDIGGTAPIVATSSTLLTNMGANWTDNATCQHAVSSPNGAESWAVRSSQTISWSSYAGADHYRLFYSTNSGGSWTEIGTTASTSYNWTVPAAQTSTARILVAAEDAGNTVLAQDMSDADFTFLTFGTILKGGIQFKGGVTF